MPTEQLKAQAQAMGLDWQNIDWRKWISYLKTLLDLLEAVPIQAKGATASGCDHHCCCVETLKLQLAAAQSTVDHLAQCDQA